MKITFEQSAFNDFNDWATENKQIYRRIVQLIKDITRNPFVGIGKPEPLKYKLKGFWSRRITSEHRLVYKIENDELFIASCKYHY